MKVKQTLFTLAAFIAVLIGSVALSPATYAATCGGVETSIIACDQTGPCSDNTDPYEGGNPGTDSVKKEEYREQYEHDYGACKDGPVNDAVTNSAIWGILLLILNILTAGVGILAVAGIVYGSVLYASAADRADQTKKAKEIILNVVIGLIAYGLMFGFLNFLIPGGIFT